MRTFSCHCGNTTYFENSQCLRCGRLLGFAPELLLLCAFEPAGGELYQPCHPQLQQRRFRRCRNGSEYQTCNWMVPEEQPSSYCRACRLNQMVPDLSQPRNVQLWYEVEKAKRRLLYSLYALGLPVRGHHEQPGGLAFQFLADARLLGQETAGWTDQRVSTGHHNGVITINLAEADPILRETMRESLNEAYRTLLGHFRHESGHYYWFRFFHSSNLHDPWLQRFRELFGDETASYSQALGLYYDQGPPPDWNQRCISAYAASHPWEDFAETWAHFLHIVDTLETAATAGFQIQGRTLASPLSGIAPGGNLQPGIQANFDGLLDDWITLTQAMNLVNRSMGLSDAYPFTLTDTVIDKLNFIHRLINRQPLPG